MSRLDAFVLTDNRQHEQFDAPGPASPGDDLNSQLKDASERAERFEGPTLQSRHFHLRAVTPDDFGYLRLIETSSNFAPRWRLRGRTPSPPDWAQSSSAGVLAQFVVVSNRDTGRLGLVTVFDANFQDGHARLAAVAFSPQTPSPVMPLAVGLFIDYVFRCWNFRKLYMDVAEYNLQQMASGVTRIFTIEGRLAHHYYLDGQHWDKFILSISREVWAQHPKRFLRAEKLK